MTVTDDFTQFLMVWVTLTVILLSAVLIVWAVLRIFSRLIRRWRRPRRRTGLYGSPEIPIPRDPQRRR